MYSSFYSRISQLETVEDNEAETLNTFVELSDERLDKINDLNKELQERYKQVEHQQQILDECCIILGGLKVSWQYIQSVLKARQDEWKPILCKARDTIGHDSFDPDADAVIKQLEHIIKELG